MFFGVLSLFLCISTGAYILMKKEYRDAHPNELIAVICICEFVTCWMVLLYQFDTVNFICKNGLDRLFVETLTLWGWITSSYEKKDASELLSYCVIVLFDLFQKMVLSLNFFLCIDLYLSFRTPFYPNRRRLTKYFIFSIIITLVTLPITISSDLLGPTELIKFYFEPVIFNTD